MAPTSQSLRFLKVAGGWASNHRYREAIDTEKVGTLIGATQGPKRPARSTGERSQAKGYNRLVIGTPHETEGYGRQSCAEAVSGYSDGS